MANQFQRYNKKGQLLDEMGELIVCDGKVIHNVPKVNNTDQFAVLIKELRKIIVGKHKMTPKSASTQKAHLLLTLVTNNQSFYFLQKDENDDIFNLQKN